MPLDLNSTVKLNTGTEIPIVGLGMSLIEQCGSDYVSNKFYLRRSGTWKSQPGAVEKAVEHALKIGYKSIDTAVRHRVRFVEKLFRSSNTF
jgi:glycerol 2-dehydrogenase (NADP+)